MSIRNKTKEEKIKELTEWFGWDDEFPTHFTTRNLNRLYKTMILEKANLEKKSNKEGDK